MSSGIVAIPELSPDELIFLVGNPAYKIILQVWVVILNHAEKDPDFKNPLRYAVDPDIENAYGIAAAVRSRLHKLGWDAELEGDSSTIAISRHRPKKDPDFLETPPPD